MEEDYIKAKRRGERDYRKAVASGRYPYLPALDDFLDNKRQQNQISLGISEVPISMIVGTKTAGRQNAFSDTFMPLLDERSEFGMKWSHLYDAQMTEGLRDPILAYEYMNRFYVQEGNKRVSVLKYLKSYSISADVIRILPERSQDPYVELYYEFVDFYNATKLNEIVFSEKGRYLELAKILGKKLPDPWPARDIELLRSAFLTFSDIYEKRNGNQLDLTMGDAFLLYLRVYSLDSLLDGSREQIMDRMKKVWSEFLVETNKRDNIELMEFPDQTDVPPEPTGIRKLFALSPLYTEKKPLKVAFLYERSSEASRWVYGHELGRLQLEETFPGIVETIKLEHCDSEEKVGAALIRAESEGCQLIFTTGAGMMPAALRVALEKKNLKILNCSINMSHNAVRNYYSRMYEAKFLMGALAASLSDSDRIGYLADLPVYGSIANINAFAIGASMLRPDIKILLKWSAQKNVDWKKEYWEEGIRVISGPDFIQPELEDREYGLYYKKDGELVRLAAPIWQWGKYYELIVRTVLNGTYDTQVRREDQAMNYWYGMSSGVIDVILSKNLSYNSTKLINILRREIISGDLVPFEGELHSQDGIIRAKTGEVLTSEEIITMDWLNDNVIGSIPALKEIDDSVKKTVKISGVKEMEPEEE